LGAEYRYVLGQGSEGYARTYFLNEHESRVTQAGGGVPREISLPGRRSYEIRGAGSQRFSRAISARGQVNYFSDVTVQQMYHSNIYEASSRQRSIGGNVTGAWGGYTLSGTFDRNETFFGDSFFTLHGAGPRVSLGQSERLIPGTPVYYAFGTDYERLLRRTEAGGRRIDSGLHRIDVNPGVRLPISRWPFLTINSSASWRNTYWTERVDPRTGRQIDEGIGRRFFNLQTQITGPVFVKVWDTPESAYAERFKHTIEPWVTVRRVTAIDQFAEIVQLEGIDSIVGSVTQIRYGLTTRLYAKRREGGPTGTAREILNIAVAQSYYTDANAAQYDRQYRTSFEGTPPSHVSPIALAVRATPTQQLSGMLRAEYDTQFGALRTIGAEGSIEVWGWLHQTAGWSQRRFIKGLSGFNDPRRLDHYLNSYTGLRSPANRVGGLYALHYDLLRHRFLMQRMVGYYNAQCCGFGVEYQSINFSGLGRRAPVPEDRRLTLSFTLAGLGSFSNVFGAFGGVPERR
jgi:hypothetical protein